MAARLLELWVRISLQRDFTRNCSCASTNRLSEIVSLQYSEWERAARILPFVVIQTTAENVRTTQHDRMLI
jgi:hypothetical protein